MLKGPHLVLAHLKSDHKNASLNENKTGINNQDVKRCWEEFKQMLVTLLPLTQVPFELLSLEHCMWSQVMMTKI